MVARAVEKTPVATISLLASSQLLNQGLVGFIFHPGLGLCQMKRYEFSHKS
jgi:hypothetical protein